MDGWMDEWMDGWMDRRTDGRTGGRTAREDIVKYFTKFHCRVSLILLKLIMWGLH